MIVIYLFSMCCRHISRAWAIAGTKYVEPTLRKKFAPSLVSNGVPLSSPEYWQCRSSGGNSSKCRLS